MACSWIGRASAPELAHGRGAPHPDRSPGPKIRGGGRAEAEFAAQPRAKAEAMGRECPTSRLGRWSGATQQPETDVAQTRVAIRGHSTVGPRPAAAWLGQELAPISLSGRVPATARTASAGVTAGVSRDGLPRARLKAKVEWQSRHSAATNGRHHLARTRPAR